MNILPYARLSRCACADEPWYYQQAKGQKGYAWRAARKLRSDVSGFVDVRSVHYSGTDIIKLTWSAVN